MRQLCHLALLLGLGSVVTLAAPASIAQEEASSPADAPAADTTATVDPEAVAALEKMGKYLRTLKSFTVHGDATIDLVMVDDQKLQFPGTVDYKVQAPDKLQMDVQSPRKHRQLFFDGKKVTIYSPDTKYYASVDSPGTIKDLLTRVEDKYGITLPLADLFLWGTDRAPTSELQSAMVVGPGRINGAATTQYAFRQPDVDWQVWIQDGSTPLPRRLVITTTDDPTEPQYATTLTWDTTPKLSDASFAFNPPEGANPIKLLEATVAAADDKEATP